MLRNLVLRLSSALACWVWESASREGGHPQGREIRHTPIITRFIVAAILTVTAALAAERVGYIEYFGYKGLDIERIRRAQSIHEGAVYSKALKIHIRQAVAEIIGKQPTDVAAICCDANGNRTMFIGLPGGSSRAVRYSDAPSGSEHLSPEIVRIYRQLDVALEMAVRRGGTAAQEDDSNGYALINDPNARSLQLEVRRWALEHAGELIQVLLSSSSVGDRRIASDALGYARQSAAQMDALVQAARDPDGEVRNNATRALLVLVRSNRQLSAHISPGIFIAMLNSPVWSDRNKGAALLLELSADRNADLLDKIRATAEDSLIEMASWRDTSHAYAARMILGRIAGIPEDRLRQLAWNGPVSSILTAAKPRWSAH